MFTDHKVLIDQDAVVDALSEFDFNKCVISPTFTNCIFKVWNVSKEESRRIGLLVTFLLEEFEAIEIKKENGIWKMYGHDAEGKSTWLLHRGSLNIFERV
jgi:hypothetical protein